MRLSIDGADLLDIEDQVVALGLEIQERRSLLREGCTCNLRLPKIRRTGFGSDGLGTGYIEPLRCHDSVRVCEAGRRIVEVDIAGQQAMSLAPVGYDPARIVAVDGVHSLQTAKVD